MRQIQRIARSITPPVLAAAPVVIITLSSPPA
jgi:hypothetical protein